MHIDNDKLVGTYVSDKYSEKGTVTIVLTDGDSTPTKEYTRYKYVQTEQLTAIGVAVKDYGAVLVPEITIALFESGVLNTDDFGVFVKFNDDYYSVSLSEILEADIAAPIAFEESSFDDYPTVTFNSTLPPFSVGNAGQVPTVDENGKVGWGNIPEELPSVTGNTGKFLGVNDDATGVEWKNVPTELPAIGDSDAGKVLKVNAEHTGVEWGEAGGGGGMTPVGMLVVKINSDISVPGNSAKYLLTSDQTFDVYDMEGNPAPSLIYDTAFLTTIITETHLIPLSVDRFGFKGIYNTNSQSVTTSGNTEADFLLFYLDL